LQLPGDVNQDGGLDLSDAIFLLMLLFDVESPIELPCEGEALTDEGTMTVLNVNGDEIIDTAGPTHWIRVSWCQRSC